ncbi:hypothetical protein BST61_g6750 [Cercospora zeina]
MPSTIPPEIESDLSKTIQNNKWALTTHNENLIGRLQLSRHAQFLNSIGTFPTDHPALAELNHLWYLIAA